MQVFGFLLLCAGLYVTFKYDSPSWIWPVYALGLLSGGLAFFGCIGLFYTRTALFMVKIVSAVARAANPRSNSRCFHLQYFMTMATICFYSFFAAIFVMTDTYHAKVEAFIGDQLDLMYRSILETDPGIIDGQFIKEAEIEKLTRRYMRSTAICLVIMFLLLVRVAQSCPI
eukprot:SAG31_NODE_229_length_19770_cov_9.887194_21_plen_171_part_00